MATQTMTQTAPPSTKPITGRTADLNLHVNPTKLSAPVTDADYHAAITILESRLPSMTPIAAHFALRLSPTHPDILIDATLPTPTLTHLPDQASTTTDVDAHVFIRAPMIRRLASNVMDSRYALNWGHIYMLSGPPRVGVKLGDVLTGSKAVHPKLADLDLSTLPKPTEDVQQVKTDLEKWGYGLYKNALSPEQVQSLRTRLMEQAAGERDEGVGFFDGGESKPNQRVWCLPNKGQEWIDLLEENKAIGEFVPDFLGDDAILFSYTANIARPGNVPMHMHTDQITMQPPVRDVAVGMNLMYFLEDVDESNGGTLVMPGSHKGQLAPDDPYSVADTVAAAGPAGTCMVFESRLWHATGANKRPGSERPVVLVFFVRPWFRQQENYSLSLSDEVYDRCSEKVKGYFGFRTSGSIGGVQTKQPEGTIVHRLKPEEIVGVLRPRA